MKYLFITEQEHTDAYHSWFKTELSKVGIQSADVEILTLIDGFASAGPVGRVTAKEIRENATNFYRKLGESNARVIVPMGGLAFRAVAGRDLSIDHARGYLFEQADLGKVSFRKTDVVGEYKTTNRAKGYTKGMPRFGLVTVEAPSPIPTNAVVIPTYSLVYVITKRYKPVFAFLQDLRRIKRAAVGRLEIVDWKFNQYRMYHTVGIENWAPVGDQFAFDIETPMDSRDVNQISLSDGYSTFTLKWNDATRDWVQKYLGNPKYTKYAHNATFDVPRLRDAGAPVVPPIFDTMIGGQLLQPDLPKALGKMASLYLDAHEWKSAYETDPDFYSAKDAFMTMRLGWQIAQKLRDTGMTDLAWKLMDTLPILLEMNEQGIRVDLHRAGKWADDLKQKMIAYEEEWMNATIAIAVQHGEPPINPGSNFQVQKLLYNWLNMEIQRTKEDGVTVDAEALFNLKRLHPEHVPMLTILEKYREVKKEYGTYAKTLAGLFAANEDRVHPQYLPGGQEGETFGRKGSATTGRPGVSNPNIQNQTPEARKMYIPDSPEHVFIENDYSQAELRVIAALSDDERLREALQGNFHQIVADRLGLPRQLAKNTMYASCYLGGPVTIQRMLRRNGIELETKVIKAAQALIKGEFRRMFAWQRATVEEASTVGYLINPFGRVRFFYGRSQDGPEAADFLPQSIVADITWRILPALDEMAHRYGGRVTTLVHDSFLIQVLARHLDSARTEFKQIMEQKFDNVAPGFFIPVESKIGAPGQAWGELVKA